MGRNRKARRAAKRTGSAPSTDFKAIRALQEPCACRKCRNHGDRWPRYYVGSISRMSYECFLESQAPTDKQHFDGEQPGYHSESHSATAYSMHLGPKMTEDLAIANGLTITREKESGEGRPRKLGGKCGICGADKPAKLRYCLRCEGLARNWGTEKDRDSLDKIQLLQGEYHRASPKTVIICFGPLLPPR